MTRGNLILIEGLDRAGKTTQTALLVETLRLKGRSVELVKFPDRTTPIGKLINSYLVDKSFSLSDESAHLLFSANRWELAPIIEQKLNEGIDIVLDRYVYSGVAYTAAKGIGRDWCYHPDVGLPRPDLTIFLNLNDSSDRKGFGDERYEVKEFQANVKKEFELFFEEDGWKTIAVDGKSIVEVKSEVDSLVSDLLESQLGEIKKYE